MFILIRNALYYLWNRETKEAHDKREQQAKHEQELRARQREERNRKFLQSCEKQWALEAKEERRRERKEKAYRKFVENNKVTEPAAPLY